MDESPPYYTLKRAKDNFGNRLKAIDKMMQPMINLRDLDLEDSEEAHFTKNVLTNTKDRLFNLTNPKGGRLSSDIAEAQAFAVAQMDYFITFQHSDVNWETVCEPLCKTKTADELNASVKFLDILLDSFRNTDKETDIALNKAIAKDKTLQDFQEHVCDVEENESLYDHLQQTKKKLTDEMKILQLKINIVSALKKKNHPLRQSVKPVMKFIRSVEEAKRDAVDNDAQPKKKKQKTFTEILNDYFTPAL